MRIALVSPWGSPCGISVHSGDVYAELSRRGHAVEVLAYEESLLTETKVDLPVSRAWKIGQPPTWRVAAELARFRPDVVHVQHEIGFFAPAAVWSEWLSCLASTGVPIVVTYHSLPDVSTAITDSPVDAAVVCSPMGAAILESRVHFPVRAIEHALDGPIPTSRDVEPNSLVTFGFLADCKGHERLLSAMVALRDEIPDLTLAILGSLTPRAMEPQLKHLEHLHREIAKRGLLGRVDVACGFRSQREVRAVLERKAIGVLHYDRTDQLKLAGEVRSTSVVTEERHVDDLSTPIAVRGTSGAFCHSVPLESADFGTSLVAQRTTEEPTAHLVKPGRAGVRCQSAALFRMWSAGLPCIVSKAQHFELGSPMRDALIRAPDVPQLIAEIRRLCTSKAAYDGAVHRLAKHVTRTWSHVAKEYERLFEDAIAHRA